MKAGFAGSFDPFHNGHLDIVKQASDMFDEVYVIFADNPDKKRTYSIKMADIVQEVLSLNNINNCHVVVTNGFTADFAAKHDIKYLVRGIRNLNDYVYEHELAKINRMINCSLRTVFVEADTIYDSISSSMIKYFKANGKYVGNLVPELVYKFMEASK